MRPDLINSLVLAYLGDSVFELIVREYLIKETNIAKPNDFQTAAKEFVSATSHMDFMDEAIREKWLDEREIDIYKRGRNTKGYKNETVAHSHSTGFEAIIGQLYLEENQVRINEIFNLYKKFVSTRKM